MVVRDLTGLGRNAMEWERLWQRKFVGSLHGRLGICLPFQSLHTVQEVLRNIFGRV